MDVAERYEMLRGSDVSRGGMYLELWDRGSGELALWAFYFDADGSLEFTRYRSDVPLEVETWFQQEARRLLPPSTAEPAAPDDRATLGHLVYNAAWRPGI
jgi:hypothetical protein